MKYALIITLFSLKIYASATPPLATTCAPTDARCWRYKAANERFTASLLFCSKHYYNLLTQGKRDYEANIPYKNCVTACLAQLEEDKRAADLQKR